MGGIYRGSFSKYSTISMSTSRVMGGRGLGDGGLVKESETRPTGGKLLGYITTF